MKIIGLKDKTLQYVFFKLSGKLTISFPSDLCPSDVLLCQNITAYKKYAFELNKRHIEFKVIMFLDYIKNLERIKDIQILNDLPEEKFVEYVKNKCTFRIPGNIKILTDNTVEDKIKEVEAGTFFSKVIQPLLYKGLKDSSKRKNVMKSVALTILELVKKKHYNILRYQQDIKPKYFKQFIAWLQTVEAKQVCECLLTNEIKYNFDSFEINYLISNLEEN